MYLDFYGLKEKPFNTTPDPRFLLLTPTHREALAQLMYGMREGTGFAVLTGEVGTGKTTLLRALLQRVDPQTAVACVVNPTLGFDGLLEYILEDLGIESGDSPARRLLALQRFLVGRAAKGHKSLIIIDEAQHLDPTTLEQIRLLSNFESTSEKLLQIVLAGQPELETKLSLPQLRQLKQRIGLRCKIGPLALEQTRDYITTRLRIAKASNPRLFAEKAVAAIHKYSRGTPRVINIVCEHSLLIGYADQVRRIDRGVVFEAIRTIEAQERGSDGGRRRWWRLRPAWLRWFVGAGAAALAGTVGGAIWHTGGTTVVGHAMSTYGSRVAAALNGLEAVLRP